MPRRHDRGRLEGHALPAEHWNAREVRPGRPRARAPDNVRPPREPLASPRTEEGEPWWLSLFTSGILSGCRFAVRTAPPTLARAPERPAPSREARGPARTPST